MYRSLLRKQAATGYYTAFLSLKRSLEMIGCDVRVNDLKLASKYKDYPIGVTGYPSVLEKIPPDNPIIFGPGDFGAPDQIDFARRDPRYKRLLVASEWYARLYDPEIRSKMSVWFAGIDVSAWPDARSHKKTVDCLIYDKIRWNEAEVRPAVVGRLISKLQSCGLSYEVLTYGEHHRSAYRDALFRSRSLAFICEHETQGLACQEAMAMNVPVFAWDEGKLIDPAIEKFAPPDLTVSSVPYFSETCGVRFTLENLERRWDAFWTSIDRFNPREYVRIALSMEDAARRYLDQYFGARQSWGASADSQPKAAAGSSSLLGRPARGTDNER